MEDPGEKGKAARTAMAKLSGTDLPGFDAQLKTTKDVLHAQGRARVHELAGHVQDHGPRAHVQLRAQLLGEKVKSKDAIAFRCRGRRSVAADVKLRFDPTYMKLAADGKL